MDSAVDGIVVADRRGVIQAFNAAAQRLFGYSEEEAVGESIGLLMPEPDKTDHRRYIERYLRTGDKRIIGIGRDVVAVHRSGKPVPIHLSVGEFRSRGDRWFVAILHDATVEVEARELRARLARAERLCAMAEMAAALAHEVNQPLAALAVYAEAARQAASTAPVSPEVASALDKIVREVRRAGLAVEKVRRLFHGEEAQVETVDATALVAEMVEMASADARPHGIVIEYVPAAHLPGLACDPVQIQQVLWNLLRNAIEAILEIDGRNGRTIGVSTVDSGGGVRIEIRDCGQGLEGKTIDDISVPFQSGKTSGLGIGLAISRTIVLNHGGSLDCETIVGSDGEPIGASFSVTVPAE